MLRQRVITALVLAPLVFVVVFWLPHAANMAVFAALVVVAAWEWSAFPGFTQHSARLAYVAILCIGIAAAWIFGVERAQLDSVMYAALLWWALASVWIATAPARVNRSTAAVAGFLVLLPAWVALVRLHSRGPELLLFLLLLVVTADIGAYFAGRQFGRKKLAPRVSPGKTWEGVFGGVAAAVLMAAVGAWWLNVSAPPFLALCLIAVVASIVGDLTESLFKRHAGLKDSGNLLPGHGGLLDRVDSVTAAAPVFLVGLERFGLLR